MNIPASAVPSREAVDRLLSRYTATNNIGPIESMFDDLLAEVERLASVIEIVEGDRAATYLSREELRAEVERLTGARNECERQYQEKSEEVLRLNATVAEQGALINQWEARCQAAWDQGDKDGDKMRGMAIKLTEQGAALAVVVAEMDKAIDVQGEGARSTTAASVPIHMVQRWRHALGGFAALASAQSSAGS